MAVEVRDGSGWLEQKVAVSELSGKTHETRVRTCMLFTYEIKQCWGWDGQREAVSDFALDSLLESKALHSGLFDNLGSIVPSKIGFLPFEVLVHIVYKAFHDWSRIQSEHGHCQE